MKISKKFNDFVNFIFPFINGLKMLLHFPQLKMMIILLVTCPIVNTIFGSLVNDKFSNLKLNVFIITDSI